jgi:hypothetical protein
MNLMECARMGRRDGHQQRQVCGYRHDYMRYPFNFPTNRHWNAYVTGFYRGNGLLGSSNRTQRKQPNN